MKNLKIKLGLLSLLAVLAVSVFLTSCEQGVVTTPIEELEEFVVNENTVIYMLPEEFNNMSDEELEGFLENISDEELEELQIPMTVNEVDLRGCGGWTYQGTRCRNSNFCNSNKGEFKAYRRWCWGWTSTGYHWSYNPRIGCCN